LFAAVAAAAAAAAAMATGERGGGARKFEATPEFVAGGSLHPYQLEGLNWLYHKAQVRHAQPCWCFQTAPDVCACAALCVFTTTGTDCAAAVLLATCLSMPLLLHLLRVYEVL
jgi:SNF2 family DNA or RNA helicase